MFIQLCIKFWSWVRGVCECVGRGGGAISSVLSVQIELILPLYHVYSSSTRPVKKNEKRMAVFTSLSRSLDLSIHNCVLFFSRYYIN